MQKQRTAVIENMTLTILLLTTIVGRIQLILAPLCWISPGGRLHCGNNRRHSSMCCCVLLCRSRRVQDFHGQDKKLRVHVKTVGVRVGANFARHQLFLVDNASHHKVRRTLDTIGR